MCLAESVLDFQSSSTIRRFSLMDIFITVDVTKTSTVEHCCAVYQTSYTDIGITSA